MRASSWQSLILIAVSFFELTSRMGLAAGRDPEEQPWETFSANVGVFISALDSSFRLGSGVGLDIDVESLLGLENSSAVFRADASWRFTNNRRHRLDFTWFSLNRNGNRRLLEDITIEDENDEEITIPAGTTLEGFFDLDIYEIAYSYSFIQDDRLDLAAGIGFYIMPLGFGVKVSGLIEDEGDARFTAPLPVFGLRMDVAITPRWFIRSGAQIFYLEYDNFTGSLGEFRGAVEYNPWTHVGMGLGFDVLRVQMEANGEDWPQIDFKGNVDFNYTGLKLYLRVFY